MRLAELTLTGWHGRSTQLVEIVGETPKRFRIRALERTKLPGRFLERGGVALVPKFALREIPATGGNSDA